MKKNTMLFLTGIIVLVFSGVSFGGDYTYKTGKFAKLSEENAYSWRINLGDDFKAAINSGETISSFTLVFDNIKEFTDDDILHISVLDPTTYRTNKKKIKYNDNGNTGNYFDSNAAELFTLEDVPKKKRDISVTYNNDGLDEYTIKTQSSATDTYTTDDEAAANARYPLTTTSSNVIADLNTYISNNILLLGIDPEGHYKLKTEKIKLILTTSDSTPGAGGPSTVPEPETLALFGLGLLGASAFGRKRFSSME